MQMAEYKKNHLAYRAHLGPALERARGRSQPAGRKWRGGARTCRTGQRPEVGQMDFISAPDRFKAEPAVPGLPELIRWRLLRAGVGGAGAPTRSAGWRGVKPFIEVVGRY